MGWSILTAVESGELNLWTEGSTPRIKQSIKTGPCIDRMRQNPYEKEIIAVGGQESDLSLWNLEAEEKCTFRAKNVPHNYLQLRVPIWVSDIAFMQNSQKIATCSRYGHLRLYDTKAQRRPVISMDIPEQALTSISACSKEHHVIVGSGTGLLMMVDLRGKGLQSNRYKGFAGGVRDIVCHPTDPYILSVSLDRYLRLHHLHSKELLQKVYLKSKLNCLLMRSDFSLKVEEEESSDEDDTLQEAPRNSGVKDSAEAAKEMDIIFSEMDSDMPNKTSKLKKIKSLESQFEGKRKPDMSSVIPQKRKKKIKK
ncbi:WD repeat-containing protein 74 isoform X2 [Hetaerina americana]|uniref:WD repeat-containing protein 74 isoform X2 n=1 Tax=Hetaerina americana TaxID=62018 RepID=UPI003A7F179B